MRGICAATLFFEAIVIALATPVMITVHSVDKATAFGVGFGLAVLALVAAAMMRRRWAYYLGHAVQVGAIATGLLVPIMFAVGVMFAALWTTAYLLGRRIEADKAGRAAGGAPLR